MSITTFESINYEAVKHPASRNFVPFSGNFPSVEAAEKDLYNKMHAAGLSDEDIESSTSWSNPLVDAKNHLFKFVVKFAELQEDHFELFASQYEYSN